MLQISLCPPLEIGRLLDLNAATKAYGLTLSPAQSQMLLDREQTVLRDLNRVDFGGGVLPLLMESFAPSPYIDKADWAQTLAELTELFYAFKELTQEQLGDAALAHAMVRLFDERWHGALSGLADASPSELHAAARGDDLRMQDEDEAHED